jgi:hypothetical protein
MDPHAVTVALSPEEWRLVSTLREIPESPLKVKLDEIIDLAVALVQDPKCSQVQADGVPCGTAMADCETCARVTGALDTVIRQLASL